MSKIRQRKPKTESTEISDDDSKNKVKSNAEIIGTTTEVLAQKQYVSKYSKYWNGYTLYHFFFIFCIVFGMKVSNWMFVNGRAPGFWETTEMSFWREVLKPVDSSE